jgi:pimeloyl-ACP methyl ester carboxylesterase
MRGLLGRHSAPSRLVHLHTTDDVRLRAVLLPGPAQGGAAVVLLHGFSAHSRKPRYAWLADELATRFTVLAPDLRGHGRSAGASGLGSDEHHDAAAAVAHLRERGHDWIAVVGVSMGATSAAHAVRQGLDHDATVLVSGPGFIELQPSTRPMQQLQRLWQSTLGRSALRAATGVRVVRPTAWVPPPDPADAVRGVDGPLLVVHGADDHYFPLDHAHAVAAAAPAAVLWQEPTFGHAEDGFDDPFGRRLADALRHAQRTGAFPAREDSPWLS